jgi:superoxide dismutase, Cu-Zn family
MLVFGETLAAKDGPMKTLPLALLMSVAICTACSTKEESVATTEPVATPAPAPVDTAANAPAAGSASTPAPATEPVAAPATAQISLTAAAGSSVKGDLTVTNEGSAVSIRGDITGLAPGKEHGFHIHEVGECSLPDFKSAGEHYNPTKDPHGGPKSKARHLGDFPNAKADETGRATIDVTVKGPTLGDTDVGPAEIFGKALVVHAMPDDYKTQPSGNSGERVACGVIR